jgi:hypothetical protein
MSKVSIERRRQGDPRRLEGRGGKARGGDRAPLPRPSHRDMVAAARASFPGASTEEIEEILQFYGMVSRRPHHAVRAA